MEYCKGGSLQDLINERKREGNLLSEEYVWTIGYQLASALLYCHLGLRINEDGHVSSDRKNILDWKTVLHRDIKPANVFMMNRSETALDSIKLGDFGLGYVLQNDDHPGTYVGTAQFLAPEISRLSADRIRWTTDCDIFSFGCTLYTLCRLRPPFANHLEAEQESCSPIPDIYTLQLRELIASCLSFSPEARPQNVLHLFQQCQRRVLCPRDDVLTLQPNPLIHRHQPSVEHLGSSWSREERIGRPRLGHVLSPEIKFYASSLDHENRGSVSPEVDSYSSSDDDHGQCRRDRIKKENRARSSDCLAEYSRLAPTRVVSLKDEVLSTAVDDADLTRKGFDLDDWQSHRPIFDPLPNDGMQAFVPSRSHWDNSKQESAKPAQPRVLKLRRSSKGSQNPMLVAFAKIKRTKPSMGETSRADVTLGNVNDSEFRARPLVLGPPNNRELRRINDAERAARRAALEADELARDSEEKDWFDYKKTRDARKR